MEEILSDINGVVGVSGSFVCDIEGQLLASALPVLFDKSILSQVSRIITQTLSGLSMARKRKATDMDLVFTDGRIIVKNHGAICLCVLCTRNINVPLLSLTANSAGRKLLSIYKSG